MFFQTVHGTKRMVVTPKCLLLPLLSAQNHVVFLRCLSAAEPRLRGGLSGQEVFGTKGTSDGYPLGPVAYTETCSERFYHQHVQVPKMEVLTHVSSM